MARRIAASLPMAQASSGSSPMQLRLLGQQPCRELRPRPSRAAGHITAVDQAQPVQTHRLASCARARCRSTWSLSSVQLAKPCSRARQDCMSCRRDAASRQARRRSCRGRPAVRAQPFERGRLAAAIQAQQVLGLLAQMVDDSTARKGVHKKPPCMSPDGPQHRLHKGLWFDIDTSGFNPARGPGCGLFRRDTIARATIRADGFHRYRRQPRPRQFRRRSRGRHAARRRCRRAPDDRHRLERGWLAQRHRTGTPASGQTCSPPPASTRITQPI